VGEGVHAAENHSLPDCDACYFIRQIDSISGEAIYGSNLADECSESCPESENDTSI
jgi:hypothetical protein